MADNHGVNNLHPPPLPFNNVPLPPPGRYNLQGHMDNHPIVGPAVINSAVMWLNAAEVESILLAAEANLVPVSTEVAPNNTIGLFVYRCAAYNDHRNYQHVGPASLIARQRLVEGDSFVNMGKLSVSTTTYIVNVSTVTFWRWWL